MLRVYGLGFLVMVNGLCFMVYGYNIVGSLFIV